MSHPISGVRCAAIVGPQSSGKTSLLRALMRRTGARDAESFGDASAEARKWEMTTDPNYVRFDYLDDAWRVVDCPGSVELLQDSLPFMKSVDVVIVVVEPDAERVNALYDYLHFLDKENVPHCLFINKMDDANMRVRDILSALQTASDRPLVLRQAPIREGEKIVGAVDLVSERAWRYREGEASELIEIPEGMRTRETEARDELLDTLADFDDALLEQLLEDKTPPAAAIYDYISNDFAQDLIVPVFLGSAQYGHGVTRLLKFLRHESPDVSVSASRFAAAGLGENAAVVVKTAHAAHAGKLSVARVLKGAFKDGDPLCGGRMSGLLQLHGETREKIGEAQAGELIAIPRTDELQTGDLIVDGAVKSKHAFPVLAPVYLAALRAKRAQDDVKLSESLAKLCEEDPSLNIDRREATHELVLQGRGEVHLRLAAARLKDRFNVEVDSAPPRAAYMETIRAPIEEHARHKKQSGGHGQFADIKVKILPRARGEGFEFTDKVTGGVVPKQFIPAVQHGVVEGLTRGPLGFPVVDVGVILYDGQHHSVDSSEMAFKIAGRQAMSEGLPKCNPILLEPIFEAVIDVPNTFTNKVHSLVAGRRGQILGFDAKPGWPGWDQMRVYLPEAALSDLIIDLRSLTQGCGRYEAKFDHYQELMGKEADIVINERRGELAA